MDFGRYTIDDFICDETFQQYVFHSDKDHFDFWNDWVERNPHKIYEVEEARKVLLELQVGKRTRLPEDHLLDINDKINRILDKKTNNLHTVKRNKNFGHLEEKKGKVRSIQKNIFGLNKVAAVAAFLVLAFTGIFYAIEVSRDAVTKEELVMIEKLVPRGQKLTLTLSDGSVVKLNSESKIQFPKTFSTNKREVFLEGEAYFEVARNESNPFVIHTGEIKTTVLGTSFNVRAYNHNKVQVAVSSGKVKVENTKTELESVFLSSNEMARCANDKIELSAFDSEKYFGWKDGVLVFKGANIDEVISALERWYDVSVHVVDKELITGKFEGTYSNKSLDVVMEGISYTSKFTYTIENKNLTIIGKH
ncbi:FecR family protein [Flexithrix dorotheae]|uniref:FecR family protein n=1 Tax=Flexithrix dorotheae TaxID=70993 RepID=UPI0003634677|nr:FecR domain-containing protein [Flexithrix dorotheae]